ncbi:MAG: cysteine desulfurase family protein [Promethearchaeota archaeon]
MKNRIIYLDHSATTPVAPEVLEVMVPYFSQLYGNASSLHQLGRKSREAIEYCRMTIAEILGAEPNEIIFTGSGTESDNIAILGTAYKLKKHGKHVITSNVEHPAVMNTFKRLKLDGFDVTTLEVDEKGLIYPDQVEDAIKEDTTLVSIMFVNNEIGTIMPIKEIAEITSQNSVIFHTDAVQALGKVPINLKEIKVDLLSSSAHKIYGPKGVGLLFMRNGGKHKKFGRYIQPIIYGGGHEFGYRSATENVPGIVGFAKAIEIAYNSLEKETERLTNLRNDFIDWVLKNIEDVRLNGDSKKRVSININLSFKGVDGADILRKLDENGIAVSTGSACHSKSREPSYVLRAIGLDDETANSSIRITLGKSSNEQDLNYVKKILQEIIDELREKKD